MSIRDDKEILDKAAVQVPSSRLVWTAIVNVGPRESLGTTAHGDRFIVPILGGRFYTGAESDALNGVVLAGGADRQLLRSDGVKELDALYEMKIDDGPVITIRNRVIIDESREGARYALSVIEPTVESGRFDWINRRVLIGTLETLKPAREAVVVRAWLMDATS